ncbi:MAG: 50S ribosome-binding GTPase [Phycisphaerae bacterium]|nr:50S ribosome-binding GTPase [Phycisphaerae bacterium]
MFALEDTITAISSPPGEAVRGVLRLSGPTALELAKSLFYSEELDSVAFLDLPGRSRIAGRCWLGDNISIAAEAYVFRAPSSYTTQDMVEIHTSGNQTLLQMLLNQLLSNGARLAGPGEFTARAFFNGRIDLTEAQAVASMIHAQSDAQLRASERLLEGQLYKLVASLSESVAHILALTEASIDFSQEEIEFANNEQFRGMIKDVQDRLKAIVDDSITWQEIQKLPQVVVAGPANAGKSSLVNKLLGMDRAIVSNIAGTTRDLLTAPMKLSDGECMLIDTAGLGEVVDPLAGQTQELSRKALQNCDLLVWMMDPTRGDDTANYPPEDIKLPSHVIVLVGKADLFETNKIKQQFWDKYFKLDCGLPDNFLAISPVADFNIDAVRKLIEMNLTERHSVNITAMTVTLTVRQRQALIDANNSLASAYDSVDMHEIAALELRDALDYLGTISGKVTPDEILGQIFGQFCIGK